MTDLTLFYFPATCARVALIALEQTGMPFETQIVRFFAGEHKRPAYLALNPLGKVPTLVADGRALTENLAIIGYLQAIAPDAQLLPRPADTFDAALAWSDLAMCSATLHPLVTRLRMAQIIAGPDNAGAVWRAAEAALNEAFVVIEQRLSQRRWMQGDAWSIIDAYVFWLWDTAVGADFDAAPFPALAAHSLVVRQYPSVARALAVEAAAFDRFAAEGTPFGLPPSARPRD